MAVTPCWVMRTNTPVGSTKNLTPDTPYALATSSRCAATRLVASPLMHNAVPSSRSRFVSPEALGSVPSPTSPHVISCARLAAGTDALAEAGVLADLVLRRGQRDHQRHQERGDADPEQQRKQEALGRLARHGH